MNALITSYQVVAYYASFALFAVLSSGLNCLCLLNGWMPATDRRERFFQRLVRWNFSVFVRWVSFLRIVPVRYQGFDGWPNRDGLVIVANHPGLMDVGWLLARMPPAICIYKPGVRHNPLYGAIAARAGYIAGDHGHHLLRRAAAKLAAGHNLLVFPEGTRTHGGPLNPFKPGFVAMARIARAPLQLVRISCDSDLLTKGRPWWRVPRLPARVAVTLGPCLPPPGRDTDHVVAAIEAWYRQSDTDTRSSPAPAAVAAVEIS